MHGKGVFAVQDIAAGETLIEYVGEIVSWDEAQDRHPHDPANPNHTFYFHVDEDRVIDALHGGNSSRWINHSCDPNCEIFYWEVEPGEVQDDRLWLQTIRAVEADEELLIDYSWPADAAIPCRCGAATCRGWICDPAELHLVEGQEKEKPGAAPQGSS